MRPSLIPGAGYGLFTTVHLPADTIVEGCTYGGRVLTLMEARRVPFARLSTRRSPRSPPRRAPPPRRRRAPSKEYLMALHFNVHVDATDYPGYLARYVNDNLDDDGARRNARFVKDPERRLARRTTRPVAPGEELYAEYGEDTGDATAAVAEEEEDAEPQTDRFGSGRIAATARRSDFAAIDDKINV